MALGLVGIGCAQPASGLPSFADVTAAPKAIQAAARAVVRVEIAGEVATGSFISSTGLLLTANHVLGSEICPIEGCYFQLAFLHQRDVDPSDGQVLYGVPMAADVGRDVAIVQVYPAPGQGKLDTPDFLSLEDHTAPDLLGTNIHVVGHPEGCLKKWSHGQVIDGLGDWFKTTAYAVPGSSGSPVLNDAGNVVGIIDRVATGADLVTPAGYDDFSVGVTSAAISAIASQPLPAVMVSVQAQTTASALVALDRLYLNARRSTATVAGQPVAVLDALGLACDAALARTDIQSADDLTAALLPCSDALLWIECRGDAAPVAYGVQCPAGQAQQWTQRYQGMNARWRQLNGEVDLAPVSFGVAALQSSFGGGVNAGSITLSAALAEANPPLDLAIARELSAFEFDAYQGRGMVDYVKGYASVPGYPLFGAEIVSAALWLESYGKLTQNEMLVILKNLFDDPSATVATRLGIEEQEYIRGLLK